MNSVVVYFPWGAGGNLVRNIITLDTRFEFIDDQIFDVKYPTIEQRYNWLLSYYQQPTDPEGWLPREWSIRAKMHARYYVNGNITYWNPGYLLAYDVHGGGSEIDNMFDLGNLKFFDRAGIAEGRCTESVSSWTLLDCEHVFLLPSDITEITKIYNSKNPTINQLENEGDLEFRRQEAQIINTTMTNRLVELQQKFTDADIHFNSYTADDLYKVTGASVVNDIVRKLNLQIPDEYVNAIHAAWLANTRTVYKKYFNRDLII